MRTLLRVDIEVKFGWRLASRGLWLDKAGKRLGMFVGGKLLRQSYISAAQEIMMIRLKVNLAFQA
jgi:hypothetical protein